MDFANSFCREMPVGGQLFPIICLQARTTLHMPLKLQQAQTHTSPTLNDRW